MVSELWRTCGKFVWNIKLVQYFICLMYEPRVLDDHLYQVCTVEVDGFIIWFKDAGGLVTILGVFKWRNQEKNIKNLIIK